MEYLEGWGGINGSLGFYIPPTEPRGLSDGEIEMLDDQREVEWEARPTYEELMEQYDCEIEEA